MAHYQRDVPDSTDDLDFPGTSLNEVVATPAYLENGHCCGIVREQVNQLVCQSRCPKPESHYSIKCLQMTNRPVLIQDGCWELCVVGVRVSAPPKPVAQASIQGNRYAAVFMYNEGSIYAGQESKEQLEVFAKTCGQEGGACGGARTESFQHPI